MRINDDIRVLSSALVVCTAGNLVIHSVQRFDAGTYLCKAANGAGLQQDRVISVDVLGL